MRAVLAGLRLTLELGWTYPPLVALGQFGGVFRHLPPLGIYIGFAFLLTALLHVVPALTAARQRLQRWSLSVALAFAAAATAVTSAIWPPSHANMTWTVAINFVLLALISFRALAVASEDTSYGQIVGAFRSGSVGMIVGLLAIYATHGVSYTHVQATLYPALIAYVLLGIFAMAYARRFSPDDYAADRRTESVEPEWVLSVILLVGAVAVIGLALTQLLLFNLIGAMGTGLSLLEDAFLFVLTPIIHGIFIAFSWLFHLLGLHPTHKALRPTYRGPVHNTRGQIPKPHKGHVPAALDLALKVIGGILGAGILALLAALAVRTVRFPSPSRLRSEQRTSTWSWRKVFAWFFRHGREELQALVPHPHLGRRPHRRLTTVREVYRALLVFGREHARAKGPGETGLEYSGALADHWPATTGSLEHLNLLYMSERYGSQPESPDALQAAIRDLHGIESAAHARGP